GYLAQQFCHFIIHRGNAFFNIYYKYDNIGFIYCKFYLAAYLGFKNIIRAFYVATGINNRKFFSVPFALSVISVARNAAYRVYDSFPALYKSVKKGGFTHVWPSYNSYDIIHPFV